MEENKEQSTTERQSITVDTPKKVMRNNYTFNNCTVTINEEGKAIDLLQKKHDDHVKAQQMVMGLANTFASAIKDYVEKAASKKPQPAPKPVAKKKSKTKK